MWRSRQLEASGRKAAAPELVFTVIDHVIDSAPGRTRNQSHAKAGTAMIEATRLGSAQLRLHVLRRRRPAPGDRARGVARARHRVARPTLVCGDSHTCTVGGIGALAWGIGSTEGEHVLATQTLAQGKPRTMRVSFEGTLAPGVFAKDMILALIGRIGANGGIGYAVEFAGSTVRAMPVEGRLTICNMAIEFQAKYGFVAPDETTIEYLRGREFAPRGEAWDRAVAYWRTLPSDPGAAFDAEISVDVSALRPQVTWGTSPQQVAAIDAAVPDPSTLDDPGARQLLERALEYVRLAPGTPMQGIPIDAAYIGSCTNARLSDLRIAAQVLRGRRVAPGVVAICVPGSTEVKRQAEAEGLDHVFRDAGFEWHESGCSMCGHMGNDRLADLRVLSTTNRNFEGRQGPRTRTHLASPATVAASAVEGRIADARRFVG